jgi:hypothetical protein
MKVAQKLKELDVPRQIELADTAKRLLPIGVLDTPDVIRSIRSS